MRTADHPGPNRRHFLKHVAGLSALAVPGMQFLQTLAAAAPTLRKEHKSVIILWMGGGPATIDLWDLKPGESTGGDFKPMRTSASGVEISEILPTVAGQMKHLAIVRSLVTREGSHERGTVLMNTGRQPSPIIQYPAMGAVLSSQLAPKELALPGFIGIGGVAQRIGAGFLGSLYAPFTVQNPGQPPENIRPPSSLGDEAAERMRRRQRLFYAVEDNFTDSLYPHLKPVTGRTVAEKQKLAEERKALGDSAMAHETIYQKAFDLTVSKLRDVFTVTKESKATIDAYGGARNQFGMGCLLARRLVEQGVSCVEVDLGGWDTHANNFTQLRTNLGPRLDKGMGTLVKDLNDRGLWKNTVVLWMGEFGRTPRINPNAGRDHWATCWSVVVGGGLIKGGQVFGATSKDGMDVADGSPRATVGDVFATVYKALGLDPATQVRDNLGRPLTIADGKPLAGLV
jgi:uncharacterized protein (DUF1501 family)